MPGASSVVSIFTSGGDGMAGGGVCAGPCCACARAATPHNSMPVKMVAVGLRMGLFMDLSLSVSRCRARPFPLRGIAGTSDRGCGSQLTQQPPKSLDVFLFGVRAAERHADSPAV